MNVLLEILYQEYGDFKYLILDEIQNVEGWSLFVNRLLRKKIHIIATGSNSKLLNAELASHLTGCYSWTELFPFSFQEYLLLKKTSFSSWSTQQTGLLNAFYTEYINCGGFPEIAKGESAKTYIVDLFDAIVTRDIVFRHNLTILPSLK